MPDLGEHDWVEQPTTLDHRVDRLERILEAIRDRRTEGFRLAESVERLGLNANALQEALLQVDRNQQQLTSLGTQLTEVKASSATKDDVAEGRRAAEETALQFRKTALRRIYTTAMALLLIFALSTAVFIEYQSGRRQAAIDVCLKRVQQNKIILDVLRGVEDAVPEGSVQRFEALIVDCSREVK